MEGMFAWTVFSGVVFMLFVSGVCGDYTLTVLHTNDIHANVEQFGPYGGRCSETDAAEGTCLGGVARRQTLIQSIREEGGNVLLLDAGDQYQGTVWYEYYKGVEALHYMTLLGYDVMALGNHEFDHGIPGLLTLVENSTFPIICANMDISNEPRLQGHVVPSVQLDVGGQVIGIIGYITVNTPILAALDNTATVEFLDEVTSIRTEVESLVNAGVNKIIALGHSGFVVDKKIAEQVEGLDLVVGGHSNTFLYTGDPPTFDVPQGDYPFIVRQAGGAEVLVVQDYARGKYLGVLEITFDDDGRIVSHSGNPVLLDNTVEQDPTMLADVNIWAEPLVELYQAELGSSYVQLNGNREQCRLEECNMGNLITDAMVQYFLPTTRLSTGWTNVSIALWNGGGIRDSISPGQVTREDVVNVLPFGNGIFLLTVTGTTLLEILEYSASQYTPEEPSGGFLQMSGVRVTYDMCADVGSRVRDVFVRCSACQIPEFEPLAENNLYNVVTSQYLVKGGDGYTAFKQAVSTVPYGFQEVDVVSAYFENRSPIVHGLEGRFTVGADCGAASSANYICKWSLFLVVCLTLLIPI